MERAVADVRAAGRCARRIVLAAWTAVPVVLATLALSCGNGTRETGRLLHARGCLLRLAAAIPAEGRNGVLSRLEVEKAVEDARIPPVDEWGSAWHAVRTPCGVVVASPGSDGAFASVTNQLLADLASGKEVKAMEVSGEGADIVLLDREFLVMREGHGASVMPYDVEGRYVRAR